MVVNVSEDGFPVRYQDPAQKVSVRFKSFEDVRLFVQAELEFWSTIVSAARSSGFAANEAQRLITTSGRAAARQANSILAEGVDAQTAVRALSVLDTSNAILSIGTLGKSIRDAAESAPESLGGIVYAASRSLPGRPVPPVDAIQASQLDLDLVTTGIMRLQRTRESTRSDRLRLDESLDEASSELDAIQSTRAEIQQWYDGHKKRAEDRLQRADEDFSTYLMKTSASVERSLESQRSLFSESFASEQARVNSYAEAAIKRLESIEQVYVSKMVLKGPSELWANVHRAANRWKWIYLTAFALLVFGPIAALLLKWSDVVLFVSELLSQSTTGFSLTGVAVLTIPTLAYGWLLRHVSRLFIHNLTLESDAQYREVLAKTFVGLADQNVSGITEAERALVLNALFRPAPPQTTDDGPPAGILELIKKSSA